MAANNLGPNYLGRRWGNSREGHAESSNCSGQNIPVHLLSAQGGSARDAASTSLCVSVFSFFLPLSHKATLWLFTALRRKLQPAAWPSGLPEVSDLTFSASPWAPATVIFLTHAKLIPTSEPPSLLFPLLFPLCPDRGISTSHVTSSERSALTTLLPFLQHGQDSLALCRLLVATQKGNQGPM